MKEIYLFPHIPKTGGAALCENVERSLPRGKTLRLNCAHRQWYFHPKTHQLNFYEKDEEYKDILLSLNNLEKSNIEFATGHDLPYGFHLHFPQPAKYFLFIREPTARILSLYNYQRYQRDYLKKMKHLDESHKRLGLFSDQRFLINGKIPSFEEWFEISYDGNYPFYLTMTHFLQKYGYLDHCLTESSWNRLFEKFFFIGLTETMREDELFLYHEMGTGRFWANRNASRSYVQYVQLDQTIQKKILEKNQDDFTLYERAQKFNREFKKRHKNFRRCVTRVAWEKRRAWGSEKIVPLFKRALRPILGPIWRRIRNKKANFSCH
jgi:hypothetical protein